MTKSIPDEILLCASDRPGCFEHEKKHTAYLPHVLK